MFSFYSVRPVKFFHPYIKVYVLPTNTVYKVFSNSKGTSHRNRCTFKKKFKIPYFQFLQCALSDFFIFTSKFLFYLLTQFKIFSSSQGTYIYTY